MNNLSLAMVSALLTLTIEQAPPANNSRRLAGIEFTGNKFFDSDTLRGTFRHSRIGNPFQPGALEADIEMNLKALLRRVVLSGVSFQVRSCRRERTMFGYESELT